MVTKSRASELFRRFAAKRILVLGDCMLDHYIWGRVSRISPEAPVPVVDVESSSSTPGGAANVVHNLRSLQAQCGIVGVVGDDESGARLRRALENEGVDTSRLVVDPDRPTTTKTRIIAHSQQVVRTDLERRDPVAGDVAEKLMATANHGLEGWDALLISDYNKGVLQPGIVAAYLESARASQTLVCAGPKPDNLALYRGVNLVAFNQGEASSAVGFAISTDEKLRQAAHRILSELETGALLITRGEHGMALFDGDMQEHHVPAMASQVYDVSGAGDTVISMLTLALTAGATLQEATALANAAAAVVVRKVGTATATCEEVLGTLA